MSSPELTYVTDRKRHLVCLPYSVINLHKMAEDLDIKRCWFHGGNHYDVPKHRTDEILKRCVIGTQKDVVDIIRGRVKDVNQLRTTKKNRGVSE